MDSKYNKIEKVLETLKDHTKMVGNENEINNIINKIFDILAKNNIEIKNYNYSVEYKFTRFVFEVSKNLAQSEISKLETDITQSLDSLNTVRICNNGELSFFVEISNNFNAIIGLKDLLIQPIDNERESGLYCVMGQANKKTIYEDIVSSHHIFIASSTGAGKSILLHNIIISLAARYSPEELRFIIIDPKCVEFSCYEDLPHLLINPLCDQKEVYSALLALKEEIEARYKLFHKETVSNFIEYNKISKEKKLPVLPRIVVVFDEFPWLSNGENNSEQIMRIIMAKCSAAGIHFVFSTQRVDAVNTIGSFAQCRIAGEVPSKQESKTIIGEEGAHKLVGKGDFLLKNNLYKKSLRIAVGYVSAGEIDDVVSALSGKPKKDEWIW